MSSNNRASLLSGLRTGGVRSSMNTIPQTAVPVASSFPHHDMPMSAAVGGSFNQYPVRVQAEAQARMQAQNKAFQMQLMQLEIMRLQALQAQHQYQIELALQQQVQHQQYATCRTPYPITEPQAVEQGVAFTNRRSSHAEFLKTSLHVNSRSSSEDQIPMTASLNGKFGARLNPNAAAFRMGGLSEEEEETPRIPKASGNGYMAAQPVAANHTSVISGTTDLGAINSNCFISTGVIPSKSESSLNWRRGGNNLPVHNNRAASLSVMVTPPPEERQVGTVKSRRPEPLRFSMTVTEPNATVVVVDNSDGEIGDDADDESTSSSAKSEPTTPPSGGVSPIGVPLLSPREAASKRLYEGLGIGRPGFRSAGVQTTSFPGAGNPQFVTSGTFAGKAVSQPIRQPRGPPSGADELGPKNFASRIRRKAIGGLGAMLDARVNKREVEAY